jgi:hypothetical protein
MTDELDKLPIWDWNQYPDDVPVVSPRTRIAIVTIVAAMYTVFLACIWVALQP